jgi:hypothetical protein
MSGITQEDRERAKSIEWVQTIIDDHDVIAETFKNHRLAARKDALEEAAKVVEGMPFDSDYGCLVQLCNRTADEIRTLSTQDTPDMRAT